MRSLRWIRHANGSEPTPSPNPEKNLMDQSTLIRDLYPMLRKVGIFGATFRKVDGTIRTGSFRVRPPKEDGPGMSYSPTERGNLIVWDMNKGGYRTLKLSSLISVTIAGTVFHIDHQEA